MTDSVPLDRLAHEARLAAQDVRRVVDNYDGSDDDRDDEEP